MSVGKIKTYTGNWVDLINPSAADISIFDIAHALSCEARFNGHTREFYSVAQHSVFVSRNVPPGHALEALLHDAAEAYLKDMPKPLKMLLPSYQKLEQRMDSVIRAKYGLPPTMSREVADADDLALGVESFELTCLGQARADSPLDAPLLPSGAERLFLRRCGELGVDVEVEVSDV